VERFDFDRLAGHGERLAGAEGGEKTFFDFAEPAVVFGDNADAEVFGDGADGLEVFAGEFGAGDFERSVFDDDLAEAGEDLAAAGEVVESGVEIGAG
jgi:hypothetical protein